MKTIGIQFSIAIITSLLMLSNISAIQTVDAHGGAGSPGHKRFESITITQHAFAEESKIPDWVKDVAKFWVDDQIDDSGFVQVIGYLVQQGIITIPYAEAPEGEAAAEIPIWIKTSAGFWINGNISDDEFATALEWLINNGIIRV